MNRKRLTGIIMAVLFLISLSVPVLAKTNVTDKMQFDLQSYGIMTGDENGDLKLEDSVTRAEFGAMVVRMCNMADAIIAADAVSYQDVSEQDWFYHDVCILTDRGYMNGYGDGMFRPEEKISEIEAMTILVRALGYTTIADNAGGYPDGYRIAATGIGIPNGVSPEDFEAITRADAARMLYNCLDVYIMEPSKDFSNQMVVGEETMRLRLSGSRLQEKIYKIQGIVTGNSIMDITGIDGSSLLPNQIAIQGEVYLINGIERAAEYLGMEVDAYVYQDGDGQKSIKSIQPTDKNKVISIQSDELGKFQQNICTYYVEDKQKQAKLSDNVTLIKNMRLMPEYQESDMTLEKGTVTLIDNDGDSRFDIVDIEEFESFLVSDTGDNVIYFKITNDAQDKKFIKFDDNLNRTYIIMDDTGTIITPEDIEKDRIVSVFESSDEEICRIIMGPEKFSAAVQSLHEDEVVIDGKTYGLEEGVENSLVPGNTYDIYLNYKNEIAAVKETEGVSQVWNYGYIASIHEDEDLPGRLIAQMVLPGDFIEVEEKSEVEDDDSVILKLKGQNQGIETMIISDKITVNGKKMDTDELYEFFFENGTRTNRTVKYQRDTEGEIKKIVIPDVQGTELTGTNQKRKYNAKEKVFGGKMNGAFGAKDTTKVLMIPNYEKQGEVLSKEDYLAAVEINDGQEYTINGYDMDQEDECVALITIMETLQYSGSTAIKDTDKLSVLTEVCAEVNEDGDLENKMTFYSDGVKKSYFVDNSIADIVNTMVPGDLFYYSLSVSSNRINRVMRIDNAVSPDSGDGQFGNPLDSNPESTGQITSGVISDIVYQKIDDLSSRRVDRITVEFDTGGMVEIAVNSRNAPPVYLYEKRSNTVTAIQTRDIVPLEGHAMIHIKNGSVRGIVIVK